MPLHKGLTLLAALIAFACEEDEVPGPACAWSTALFMELIHVKAKSAAPHISEQAGGAEVMCLPSHCSLHAVRFKAEGHTAPAGSPCRILKHNARAAVTLHHQVRPPSTLAADTFGMVWAAIAMVVAVGTVYAASYLGAGTNPRNQARCAGHFPAAPSSRTRPVLLRKHCQGRGIQGPLLAIML